MIFLVYVLFFLASFSVSCAKPPKVLPQPIIVEKPAPTTLTMHEAVEIALLNKPSLQAYKHIIEAYKAQGMQAWSGYLPQVGLSTTFGQQLGNRSPQAIMTLDATQLVYSFAGPIEKYKQAKKLTQIQELTYDQTKKEVKHEVEQAFLDCWKLQQHNKDILALHKSNQSTYETAEHSNKLQLSDKRDWLKSNADYAQGLATVDNYYKDLALAQKKLEFFMGQPIDLSLTTLEAPSVDSPQKKQHVLTLALEWQEPKEIKLYPLIDCYKYAMKNREILKATDKSIGIAKDEVYIQAHSNLPTISLHANTGYASPASTPLGAAEESSGQPVPRNFYTVEAVVTWPIFNGLLNDYKEKEAHANMLKEMLGKEQAMQQIKLDIDQAHIALQQALTNLKAQKANLIFAKNDLDLKSQQFKIGDISKIDLDVAVTAWETANYAWLNVQIEAAKKERDLAFACGYPKELFDGYVDQEKKAES